MVIKKIEMEVLPNTRDLGGFVNSQGLKIKPNMLIRSGRLYNATENDIKELLNHNLKLIIDLRDDHEVSEKPDPEIEGVKYVRCKVAAMEDGSASRSEKATNSMEDLILSCTSEHSATFNAMAGLYTGIVTNEYSQKMVKKFFEYLLENDGAALWHCSMGKDRVGTTTALLLMALSFSKEDIIEDYLLTAQYVKNNIEGLYKHLKPLSDSPMLYEAIYDLVSVRRKYMENVFDLIENNYGGIDNYLENVIGLSNKDRLKLQEKYLTK